MNSNNVISFPAAAQLTAHQRVKLVNVGGVAVVDVAGVADRAIGTVLHDCPINDAASVALLGVFPVQYMIASEVIAVAAPVNGAALGKVESSDSTEVPIGIALQAASGDNSIIRVLTVPSPHPAV